jgi:hypothetical protein
MSLHGQDCFWHMQAHFHTRSSCMFFIQRPGLSILDQSPQTHIPRILHHRLYTMAYSNSQGLPTQPKGLKRTNSLVTRWVEYQSVFQKSVLSIVEGPRSLLLQLLVSCTNGDDLVGRGGCEARLVRKCDLALRLILIRPPPPPACPQRLQA